MQNSSLTPPRNRGGYALLITMCFLVATLIVFVSVMYWIQSNGNITAMNNQFNMSEGAAEAATEKVLSQMNYDYVAQSLSNSGAYYGAMVPSTAYQTNINWPIQYVYSDTNGITGQISVDMSQPWTSNTVPLNCQYTNLYGLEKSVTITATAAPIGQRFTVPSTVCETIQFASIPLFQFAIFYNMNLEISAAANLSISGPVWSNAGLWSGSTTVTFQNSVSAVGAATNTANDPFCSGYTGSGPSTYTKAGQPTSGNDHITMPIGTNNNPAAVEAIINIPPTTYALGTAAAFTTNGQVYLANAADLYLTNFASGTNWPGHTSVGTNMILYYQDGANISSYQTQIPYDFYIYTNRGLGTVSFTNKVVPATVTAPAYNYTNVIYAGYSFVTNALFYDWREGWNGGSGVNSGKGKIVQALQIDVRAFDCWLANTNMNGTTNVNGGQSYNTQCDLSTHKSHPIDSIYIFNSAPLTSTTMPGVRVTDGGMLPVHTAPYGFTVATAQPLYEWGDYNASNTSGSSLGQNQTTYTWPAALMGDALTVLSDGWKDSNTGQKPSASSSTTVNAACLAGIVQSTNGVYSGGVENYFRLLESWGTLWWNGAIIVMFPSQYATNSWQQTGNYYSAPTRNWAFNTNFMQQAGLPPLTPQSKGVIRGTWQAY
jgi:Tfp pilus assembly protein PilX